MEKDYIHIITSLIEEIEDKILGTENWIYYFWNIPEVQEYLIDTSNDWKEECTLRVISLCKGNIEVEIRLCNDSIGYRCLYLDIFEGSIKNNISKNAKYIISSKLKDKKESREYYSEVVKRLDDEISDLEKKLKEE